MTRKRYGNLDGIQNKHGFAEVRRWRRERKQKKKDLSYVVPQAANKQIAWLSANRSASSITWIGHATFLIQINGCNILTDPVWAKRMGLEKRLSEPGLRLDQLPPIDVVLISHGHYDHLDIGTLKRLPGSPVYLVPEGLGRLLTRRGFTHVHEFVWWEKMSDKGCTFTFVPAQHWVRRGLWDMNTSHWGGWVVQAENAPSVYFVGDTGYFRGFTEIGKRFAIDTVLMPIGAYEPEWFMQTAHINPEDAVKAFCELHAQTCIPMHYGAFRLADDTAAEALNRFTTAWNEQNLSTDRLRVLQLGETWQPSM
ncbi:L-ascorbate metabolism protein UlaG (beta-lactamase superfamily) [Aneurinibacillus soli]|uniref:Metal-dependent hydrolase n=1 Tax=Aneurinibacillus soli TaxID=1500254 RepID=A0A0U5B4W0_9BACL|nr:MBL fold metallo-hydrolase [Aneurinibacillus soli]PYE61679.1 L-ascorbate metabolism protein UlaG (beta-lactamase superfamily) [Aneurinibacillus soli]BAU28463.1 metal-dependent hydrolase [Aneurinibacillus soli]